MVLKVKDWKEKGRHQFEYTIAISQHHVTRLLDGKIFTKQTFVVTKYGPGAISFFHLDFIHVSIKQLGEDGYKDHVFEINEIKEYYNGKSVENKSLAPAQA